MVALNSAQKFGATILAKGVTAFGSSFVGGEIVRKECKKMDKKHHPEKMSEHRRDKYETKKHLKASLITTGVACVGLVTFIAVETAIKNA